MVWERMTFGTGPDVGGKRKRRKESVVLQNDDVVVLTDLTAWQINSYFLMSAVFSSVVVSTKASASGSSS